MTMNQSLEAFNGLTWPGAIAIAAIALSVALAVWAIAANIHKL